MASASSGPAPRRKSVALQNRRPRSPPDGPSCAQRFRGHLALASGGDADRAQDLAERMRRLGRRAHFLERGGKLCLARDRALHLVPGRRARAVRGEFPGFCSLCAKRGAKLPDLLLGKKSGGLPVEFARGISRRRIEPADEKSAHLPDRHDRFAGRLPGRAAAQRAPENAGRRARPESGKKSSNVSTASPIARMAVTR